MLAGSPVPSPYRPDFGLRPPEMSGKAMAYLCKILHRPVGGSRRYGMKDRLSAERSRTCTTGTADAPRQ